MKRILLVAHVLWCGIAAATAAAQGTSELARQNGVTQDELVEAITQLAFYAGWPNAISAVTVAREVFAGARR